MRLRSLYRFAAATFLVMSAAVAQPVVAPTNAPIQTIRGEDFGGYNFTNTFETGYRFRSVGGDLGKYRSDVNFGNGLRLLSGNLTAHSKEGRGKYFDELLLNTQGLGNDPYQYSSLRVGKNKLYKYDFTWRLNEYFNPGLTLASGQHFRDTTKALADHNFVLLPQSPFKVFLGYSRVSQTGPGLSTVNFFGATRGDEFPLFADIQRRQNEYRLGFEASVFGVKLSVLRAWEFFKDDTRKTSPFLQAGNNPGDDNTLSSLRRDEPYHGSTRSWRVNLLSDRSKWMTVNGRFTYAGTRRDFIFDESSVASQRSGGALNRQVLVFGNGRRPVTAGSLTLVFFPTERLTVTNHTAIHSTRIDGDGSYSELDNSTLAFSTLEFQYLGIRTLSNATDINFRLTEKLGLFTGYQYANRRIRSVEQTAFDNQPERTEYAQTNQLHTGRFGIRVQPVKALRVVLDGEIGRADRPIYPTSEKNYHAIGGRVQYKKGSFLVTALARTNYNTNSVSLSYHSSRSRVYSADVAWGPRPWLSFDASYSKLHLDTLTGIAYFYNSDLVNDRSRYISNIHTGYFGSRFVLGPRAEFSVGYSRVQDTGDGRRPGPAAPYILGTTPAPIEPGTLGFTTYPLAFDSPLARFSFRVNKSIRWNAGYQHYRYAEELIRQQNYRAHTGFTSLSWAF
ncbi:MAG: hypothetical protein H7039_20415 [Bryobacteraceae bacterium]|nr:hypothetical protein [Bryobacteraceae bacterium]